jgi:hypothetical protein
VAEKKTRKIICTAFGKGRRHDFKLFKDSKTYFHPSTKCSVDTGYQGIAKLHSNVEIPKKRSKKNPLTPQDKARNKSISSQRVLVENIIREVKIFRIVAEKYRNRRKKFGLRFNLIAAIYNLNLSSK